MIVIKKSLDLGTTMAVAMHRVIKVFYPNLMARVWTSRTGSLFVSCSEKKQTCQMFLTLPSQATVMIPSMVCTIKLKTGMASLTSLKRMDQLISTTSPTEL